MISSIDILEILEMIINNFINKLSLNDDKRKVKSASLRQYSDNFSIGRSLMLPSKSILESFKRASQIAFKVNSEYL